MVLFGHRPAARYESEKPLENQAWVSNLRCSIRGGAATCHYQLSFSHKRLVAHARGGGTECGAGYKPPTIAVSQGPPGQR